VGVVVVGVPRSQPGRWLVEWGAPFPVHCRQFRCRASAQRFAARVGGAVWGASAGGGWRQSP
jgi:hypothetical protein